MGGIQAGLSLPTGLVMQHVRNTAEATLILDVGRKAAEVDMLTGFAAQQGQHLQPWQATGQAVQGLAAVYAQLRAVISELEQLASRLKVYADVNASMHEELRLQGVSMQLVFDKLFLSRVETELAARCLAVCQQGSQVQMQPLLQGLREIEVMTIADLGLAAAQSRPQSQGHVHSLEQQQQQQNQQHHHAAPAWADPPGDRYMTAAGAAHWQATFGGLSPMNHQTNAPLQQFTPSGHAPQQSNWPLLQQQNLDQQQAASGLYPWRQNDHRPQRHNQPHLPLQLQQPPLHQRLDCGSMLGPGGLSSAEQAAPPGAAWAERLHRLGPGASDLELNPVCQLIPSMQGAGPQQQPLTYAGSLPALQQPPLNLQTRSAAQHPRQQLYGKHTPAVDASSGLCRGQLPLAAPVSGGARAPFDQARQAFSFQQHAQHTTASHPVLQHAPARPRSASGLAAAFDGLAGHPAPAVLNPARTSAEEGLCMAGAVFPVAAPGACVEAAADQTTGEQGGPPGAARWLHLPMPQLQPAVTQPAGYPDEAQLSGKDQPHALHLSLATASNAATLAVGDAAEPAAAPCRAADIAACQQRIAKPSSQQQAGLWEVGCGGQFRPPSDQQPTQPGAENGRQGGMHIHQPNSLDEARVRQLEMQGATSGVPVSTSQPMALAGSGSGLPSQRTLLEGYPSDLEAGKLLLDRPAASAGVAKGGSEGHAGSHAADTRPALPSYGHDTRPGVDAVSHPADVQPLCEAFGSEQPLLPAAHPCLQPEQELSGVAELNQQQQEEDKPASDGQQPRGNALLQADAPSSTLAPVDQPAIGVPGLPPSNAQGQVHAGPPAQPQSEAAATDPPHSMSLLMCMLQPPPVVLPSLSAAMPAQQQALRTSQAVACNDSPLTSPPGRPDHGVQPIAMAAVPAMVHSMRPSLELQPTALHRVELGSYTDVGDGQQGGEQQVMSSTYPPAASSAATALLEAPVREAPPLPVVALGPVNQGQQPVPQASAQHLQAGAGDQPPLLQPQASIAAGASAQEQQGSEHARSADALVGSAITAASDGPLTAQRNTTPGSRAGTSAWQKANAAAAGSVGAVGQLVSASQPIGASREQQQVLDCLRGVRSGPVQSSLGASQWRAAASALRGDAAPSTTTELTDPSTSSSGKHSSAPTFAAHAATQPMPSVCNNGAAAPAASGATFSFSQPQWQMDMPRSGYETPTLPVKPRQSQRDDEAMDFEPAGGGSQPLGTPSTIWDEATIPDSEDSSGPRPPNFRTHAAPAAYDTPAMLSQPQQDDAHMPMPLSQPPLNADLGLAASQQDTNPDSTHPPNARLQLSEAGGPGDPDGDQQEGPRDHRTLHHGQRALLSAAEGRVPETPESDQHASQASEHPGTQGSDDPKYTPPASLPPGSSRAAFLLMDSQRDSTSPNKKTAPRTGPGLNGSSSPSSEGLAHQGSRCRSHITDSDPNSPGNGSGRGQAGLPSRQAAGSHITDSNSDSPGKRIIPRPNGQPAAPHRQLSGGQAARAAPEAVQQHPSHQQRPPADLGTVPSSSTIDARPEAVAGAEDVHMQPGDLAGKSAAIRGQSCSTAGNVAVFPAQIGSTAAAGGHGLENNDQLNSATKAAGPCEGRGLSGSAAGHGSGSGSRSVTHVSASTPATASTSLQGGHAEPGSQPGSQHACHAPRESQQACHFLGQPVLSHRGVAQGLGRQTARLPASVTTTGGLPRDANRDLQEPGTCAEQVPQAVVGRQPDQPGTYVQSAAAKQAGADQQAQAVQLPVLGRQADQPGSDAVEQPAAAEQSSLRAEQLSQHVGDGEGASAGEATGRGGISEPALNHAADADGALLAPQAHQPADLHREGPVSMSQQQAGEAFRPCLTGQGAAAVAAAGGTKQQWTAAIGRLHDIAVHSIAARDQDAGSADGQLHSPASQPGRQSAVLNATAVVAGASQAPASYGLQQGPDPQQAQHTQQAGLKRGHGEMMQQQLQAGAAAAAVVMQTPPPVATKLPANCSMRQDDDARSSKRLCTAGLRALPQPSTGSGSPPRNRQAQAQAYRQTAVRPGSALGSMVPVVMAPDTQDMDVDIGGHGYNDAPPLGRMDLDHEQDQIQKVQPSQMRAEAQACASVTAANPAAPGCTTKPPAVTGTISATPVTSATVCSTPTAVPAVSQAPVLPEHLAPTGISTVLAAGASQGSKAAAKPSQQLPSGLHPDNSQNSDPNSKGSLPASQHSNPKCKPPSQHSGLVNPHGDQHSQRELCGGLPSSPGDAFVGISSNPNTQGADPLATLSQLDPSGGSSVFPSPGPSTLDEGDGGVSGDTQHNSQLMLSQTTTGWSGSQRSQPYMSLTQRPHPADSGSAPSSSPRMYLSSQQAAAASHSKPASTSQAALSFSQGSQPLSSRSTDPGTPAGNPSNLGGGSQVGASISRGSQPRISSRTDPVAAAANPSGPVHGSHAGASVRASQRCSSSPADLATAAGKPSHPADGSQASPSVSQSSQPLDSCAIDAAKADNPAGAGPSASRGSQPLSSPSTDAIAAADKWDNPAGAGPPASQGSQPLSSSPTDPATIAAQKGSELKHASQGLLDGCCLHKPGEGVGDILPGRTGVMRLGPSIAGLLHGVPSSPPLSQAGLTGPGPGPMLQLRLELSSEEQEDRNPLCSQPTDTPGPARPLWHTPSDLVDRKHQRPVRGAAEASPWNTPALLAGKRGMNAQQSEASLGRWEPQAATITRSRGGQGAELPPQQAQHGSTTRSAAAVAASGTTRRMLLSGSTPLPDGPSPGVGCSRFEAGSVHRQPPQRRPSNLQRSSLSQAMPVSQSQPSPGVTQSKDQHLGKRTAVAMHACGSSQP